MLGSKPCATAAWLAALCYFFSDFLIAASGVFVVNCFVISIFLRQLRKAMVSREVVLAYGFCVDDDIKQIVVILSMQGCVQSCCRALEETIEEPGWGWGKAP